MLVLSVRERVIERDLNNALWKKKDASIIKINVFDFSLKRNPYVLLPAHFRLIPAALTTFPVTAVFT